jgi:hypothetical protein
MSMHVGSPTRAPVRDAPKHAIEATSPKPAAGWTFAFLVALITVQLVWMAVLLYGAKSAIGTIGGLF